MSGILALDLETVPDAELGRRMWGLDGDDATVARAMIAHRREETDGRTDFLKPHMHRVVAVGVVWISLRPLRVRLSGHAGMDEEGMLAELLGWIGAMGRPQLVSWNGSSFDLPVLRYRALRHGLDTSVLHGQADERQWESYWYRYGERHVDIMDVLAGYGASTRLSLEEGAGLVGLPGKTVAEGSEVLDLFFAGDRATLATYVQHDAFTTALIFLRWQWSRGRIRGQIFDAVLADAIAAIDGQSSFTPFVQAIADWRASTPMAEAVA